MLRFTVSEAGQPPLPAVDLDEPRVVIGSGSGARIRLPADAAGEAHVEVTPSGWRALAAVIVGGAPHEGGAMGPVGDGVELSLGAYRVRVEPSPPGAIATPPQRTESLARELVRGLLGAGAAPTLRIERGPAAGAARMLPPPEAVLVIGRGDEAGWVILDADLSRAHAEIRRGWDGVWIRDLGSKNGTRVGGARVGAASVPLHDGARIELGDIEFSFSDPAERHLRGAVGAGARAGTSSSAAAPGAPPGRWVSAVALAIAVAAVAGLIWILAS
ncbi:MAG TPA: FHA domain-containing protein [Kofleriaceae bacterium]|nr:FHA domain-containing protein [Kofleriaceae bacterium]